MKLGPLFQISLASSFLGGCMVGPNYHKPAVQTPVSFHDLRESPQGQAQAASYADLPWWQVFQDPQLQDLIRTALKQNYDMQIATERINADTRSARDHPLQFIPASSRKRQFRRRQRAARRRPNSTSWT